MMWRFVAAAVAGAVLVAGGTYTWMARTGRLAPTEALVLDAYGQMPSILTTIDGVPIRYKDEGRGPPVVLLHAGLHSIEMWDAWAATLKTSHRVIRLDLPPNGISGPDPRGWNSGEHTADLVIRLLEKLNVEPVTLAGISSGSTVALRLAAMYPDRVKALILASVPIAPPAGGNQPLGLTLTSWLSKNVLGGYRPKLYWREQLKSTFGDDAKISEALVNRQWMFNELPGRNALTDAYAANNRASGFDYAAAISKMEMPVLIQWGAASQILPPDKAKELAALFTASRQVETKIYPGVGHYLYLEAPEESLKDAIAFLEGIFR